MSYQVNDKENLYFSIMVLWGMAIYGVLIKVFYLYPKFITTNPILYLGAYLTIKWIGALLFRGYLVGNAVQVNKDQFPEVYELLQQHCAALNLKVPNMYVMNGNGLLNAFVTRMVWRNYVVIYSDVLDAAYKNGMEVLSFIIGHELGHLKRNHVGKLKNFVILPARLIPFLSKAYSRACEYTCDNIGYWLSPRGAKDGILLLSAGKKLYKKVNSKNMLLYFEKNNDFFVVLSELFSTHPPLAKRLGGIEQHLLFDSLDDQDMVVSPKVDISSSQKQKSMDQFGPK